MTYYINYTILDGNGVPVGNGGSIRERFVLPRSMDDIKRLGDVMTDEQRRSGILNQTHWLSVMGWSEMGR